jgi:hypothetical protein
MSDEDLDATAESPVKVLHAFATREMIGRERSDGSDTRR